MVNVSFVESKTNKQQPHYVMQGFASGLVVLNDLLTKQTIGTIYG